MTITQPRAARGDRRPTVSRDVIVTAREQLTDRMLRLTLGGTDLLAAVHDAPGAWVKLFITEDDGFDEHGRAYTVRGFDPVSDEISLDVFLHDGGAIPRWAREVRIGDTARIGGPRQSRAPGSGSASLMLFGDETALPAISAILEREHAGRPAHAVIETGDDRDRQDLELPSTASVTWLHREHRSQPGAALVDAAARMRFAPDAGVWFAAEAAAAHHFRKLVSPADVAELHVHGYWRRGVGDYRE